MSWTLTYHWCVLKGPHQSTHSCHGTHSWNQCDSAILHELLAYWHSMKKHFPTTWKSLRTIWHCGGMYVYSGILVVWKYCCCVFSAHFGGLTTACSWPLMLAVQKGRLMERRLSHSLGRDSGTDSMKLLFSSLMLVWWRIISVWVLSTSFNKNVKVSVGKITVIGETTRQ